MRSGMRKTLSLVALIAGCGLLAASALGSVSQAPPPNTFRLSLSVDIDYADPALAYYAPTWALTYATGALLYNYPDAPAPRGSRLVPEVAAGFPRISRDGRIYTFRLKKTYRFSNGLPLTARDFHRALYRVAHARMGSPGYAFISDIVGAEAFNNREAPSFAGVVVRGEHTLQIRLRAPRGDILARLAMPFFAAVPERLNINPEGVSPPIPSAGPYFIREWTRGRRIILERNRFYRGPRPHRVRRIDVDIGLPLETIKLNIDRGATDAGDIPPAAHAELGHRYGVRKRSPGRYFANPTATVLFLPMNHDRSLFGGPTPLGNVRLKRAVNFAINRWAMMRQRGAYGGGTHDQLLPPTTRGFRDVRIYPRLPDVPRARDLARGALRSGRGIFYCSNRSPAPQTCQVVQANLREIGLEVDIRLYPRTGDFFRGRRGEPFDLELDSWRGDYLDPYAFFFVVDGATIRPCCNKNLSYFNDPGFRARIAKARSVSGAERYRWFADLDANLMRDAAPVAVYGVPNDRVYVSARVGCYHHHPVYGWNFGAICLRS